MTKLTNEQIEQILEGAPEGFTHCANGRYMRLVVGEVMQFTQPDLEPVEIGSDSYGSRLGSGSGFGWDGKPVESLESLREILSLRQEVERLQKLCGRCAEYVSDVGCLIFDPEVGFEKRKLYAEGKILIKDIVLTQKEKDHE